MKLGITGHRDLGGPGPEAWVRRHLRDLIDRERPAMGFSCLAEGADQVFAETIIEAGIPLVAILPCHGYDATLSGAAAIRYPILLQSASRVRVLPFPAPCEEAYYQAGRSLVNRVDCLAAVWNGAPPRGLGGTADVVKFALNRGKRVLRLDSVHRTVEPADASSAGKRIFVCSAAGESERANGLRGLAADQTGRLAFTELPEGGAANRFWRQRARARMRGCDVMILFPACKESGAAEVLWAVETAHNERLPILVPGLPGEETRGFPELRGYRISSESFSR
jgi:hypothetical protein